MKAATELIVNAAIPHLRARVAHYFERVAIASACVGAQQELERHRRWELRGAAKAAVDRVVVPDHSGVRGIKQLGLDRVIRTASFTQPSQFSNQRSSRVTDL